MDIVTWIHIYVCGWIKLMQMSLSDSAESLPRGGIIKMPTADTHGLPWTTIENCCEFAAAPMWIVVLNSVMWPTKTSQRPLTLCQADNGTSVLKESALWKWFDFFLNLFVCLCALLWWARALERAKWTRERESCCGGGCYYLSHTHYLSLLSHYALTPYFTLHYTVHPI